MNVKKRNGQTMLELVAASTIITIALVPALRLTRDSMSHLHNLELAELRASFCASKLEEELVLTAGLWDLTEKSGNFSSQGCSEIAFSVSKSDADIDGGIAGKLAVVRVTVWNDLDQDGAIDADEPHTEMETKVARITSYGYEATLY